MKPNPDVLIGSSSQQKHLKFLCATAQENIAKLPAECFGVLPSCGQIIKIKAGESGYYPLKCQPPGWKEEPHPYPTVDKLCDELNAADGITRGQRNAMESGSMFGWNCPGANPDNFNADGTYTT
jgi:hypothetical protein